MDGHYLLKSEEIKYQSAINIVRNNKNKQSLLLETSCADKS